VTAPLAGLVIDVGSAVPPYEQLRAHVAAGAVAGTLPAGTRLPPVRRLAEQLGLAANTVARSYRELEEAGIVETRGRNGTVISAGADRGRARLQDAAAQYTRLARELGIDADEALAYVRSAYDAGR
jgi:DNA-binding transcriptional regulator YhcF (GntR family)